MSERNKDYTMEDWYKKFSDLVGEEGIDLRDEDFWHRIQIVDNATKKSERFSIPEGESYSKTAERLMQNFDKKSIYVIGNNGPKKIQLNESTLDPELGNAPEHPGREPEEAPAPSRWQRFANRLTFGRAYRSVFEAYENNKTERAEYERKVDAYASLNAAVSDYRKVEMDVRFRDLDNRLDSSKEHISENVKGAYEALVREDVSAQMVAGKYHEAINNQRTSNHSVENVNNFERGNK